ncbi:formylglycine-generating enzyme family protein [Nitrospina gracilis]|uniref:formylglycine-generating enzyme family protein n=1 Tax=Nitrospina gracilis TaxID=35801 RepID=UPI001F24CEE2|nr:SUMF1/EgtB/PvdO family nonheme iron enzyme [Nitrospina gracilis]MCF8720467.1 formylglycine-generating enzyme required for sulfatase activity [Nitrospina gracilis Nb-211]
MFDRFFRFVCLALLFLPGLAACGAADCDCGVSAGGPLPERLISEVDGKEMVLVPAGEFIMGTDMTDPEKKHLKIGAVKPLFRDQQPSHTVHLDAFYIDKYEVTNREYKQFIESVQYHEFPAHWVNGMYMPDQGDLPVTNITWGEALAYAMWAGKSLPTEAQWEKAARGTDGRLYPWGNDYKKGISNIGLDGPRKLMPVGSFPEDVSPFQAFDMAGNVMEWTLNWYLPYPGSDFEFKKFGTDLKVLRGNGFQEGGHFFLDEYRYVFHRSEVKPDDFFDNVGFRCVSPFLVSAEES